MRATELCTLRAMPSIGEVIHDQTGLGERESQEVVYERYKTQLEQRYLGVPVRLSYPAKAGFPVRRGFSVQSLTSLEYWITLLRG
jgi:hypothetical protein